MIQKILFRLIIWGAGIYTIIHLCTAYELNWIIAATFFLIYLLCLEDLVFNYSSHKEHDHYEETNIDSILFHEGERVIIDKKKNNIVDSHFVKGSDPYAEAWKEVTKEDEYPEEIKHEPKKPL